MPESISQLAELEDICSLPLPLQRVYVQLIAAIDGSLQRLQCAGASPNHLTEDFIESLVEGLLDQSLSEEALQERVNEVLMRSILEETEFPLAT